MRPLLCFFIISIFALCSCNTHNQKISMVGKWHRFSWKNGYTEFDIDSQHVVFYNHKVGRFKLAYKIVNDSIKYLTHKYAGKITCFGDSLKLNGNDSTTATLYRFIEPNIPFDSIPQEDTNSIYYNTYLKGFDKRLIAELKKAGFMVADGQEEKKDTSVTFEKLMNSKSPH